MNERFAKLLAAMGGKKSLGNPGVDDSLAKKQKTQTQLDIIDQKIAELEDSDDPNALESLNFWKSKRDKIAGGR